MPEGCEIIMMPKEEVYGCNTIGLPGNKVLIADGYPTVKKTLEDRGFECVVIDMEKLEQPMALLLAVQSSTVPRVLIYAGWVAKLLQGLPIGQRRWDEVPVSMSSQVQILPSAPLNISKSVKLLRTTQIRMRGNIRFVFIRNEFYACEIISINPQRL